MNLESSQRFRHADPEKVRIVWDVLDSLKASKQPVLCERLIKSLRKKLSLKDDNIRLLLNEIEGDGLIDKVEIASKGFADAYKLPDFSIPFQRQDHDWYCSKCHLAGVVMPCSECFRVFHQDCVNDILSHNQSPIRSPILHDSKSAFLCPICESRPKCEFSRKQIRKLLDFATHSLRKQSLWKTFTNLGYKNIVKNEFLVHKYIDLDILNQKIKDGRYTALENFAVDVELLVHNVCILHGPFSHEADEARFFLRSVKMEIIEIELCTDCYINAKAKPSDWISKPCKPCHEIIWASHRTPRGAGMFSDAVITDYYWPAKILLEKDDGFEIRFFGGTHERMFVKREYTKSFKIPPSSLEVMRKSSHHGTQCSSGGFERAWNEIQKLQNNIDSGYYTHSSGESDLPPSDDDYSDEMYVRVKRGKNLTKHKESLTNESPKSSIISTSNSKVNERKRHESSTSNQASSITSSINPSVSPSLNPPKARGRPSNATKKVGVIQPEPGSAAAFAMSVLAETKAALNSGSSLRLSKFLDSSSSSVKESNIKGKRKQLNSISPKKTQRGRPSKRYKAENSLSSRSASSGSSTSSPSSRDSNFNLNSQSLAGKSSASAKLNGVRKKSLEKTPSKSASKSKQPTKKANKNQKPERPSKGRQKKESLSKKDLTDDDDDDDEEEDELTDRCVSEDMKNSDSDGNESSDSSSSTSSSASSSSYLLNSVLSNDKKQTKKSLHTPSSRSSHGNKKKAVNDIALKRPPFAPKPSTKSENASNVNANSSSYHRGSNASASQETSTSSIKQNSHRAGVSTNSPNVSGLNGFNTPSTTASSSSASLLKEKASANQSFASPPISTIPRSHLPPNKRAAAEAAAMAMQSAGIISQKSTTSSQTHPVSQNPVNNSSSSSLSPLAPNQVSTTQTPQPNVTRRPFSPTSTQQQPSSLSTVHKAVQVTNVNLLPCGECKDREKTIAQLEIKHKQQIADLQERLMKQFADEKKAAVNAAVDEVKADFSKRIEKESAINQKVLEDAEAKMTEAIIQTKRRQWCRNCLKEAIYHCCWNTSYCSIPCQQDHWQKEHKRQCRRKR